MMGRSVGRLGLQPVRISAEKRQRGRRALIWQKPAMESGNGEMRKERKGKGGWVREG